MKVLIIFLLLFNCSLLYSKQENIDIKSLLESGKFEIAKNKINNISDVYLKNYYNALYHLYLGDYQTAENYILEISSIPLLDDEKQFFLEYIPLLNKILSNGYMSFDSEHFKVMLKGRDIILKDYILEKLEDIYSKYKELFLYAAEDKVRVEVYNTKDEFAFASTLGKENVEKAGVVGICKFNRIMILSPENLPFGYRWCDTLAHEYIHFILNRITEFTYPLYLHEGTARYFDTLYRSENSLYLTAGNANLLLDAKKNNKLIKFKDLKGSLVYLDSQQQVELAFSEVASFVEFLISSYGKEKFIQFVYSYKKYSNNEDKLYLDIFKTNFEKILNMWEDFIDTKEEISKLYSGAKPDFKFFSVGSENILIGLDTKQYIELGDKFLANRNYKAALYQYKKAQQQENFNPVVLTRIAKINFLLKNYNEAENILQECIKANPNYVNSYELLVKIYYEKGEYEKIFDVFRNILEINPFNYEIRNIVAEVYADLGKIKEAVKEYEVVSILNPSDTKTKTILDSLKRYLEMKNSLKK